MVIRSIYFNRGDLMSGPFLRAALLSVALICSASAQAAQISVADGGSNGKAPVILIAGDVAQGDDEKFGKLAAQYSSAIVVLDSDGGSLLPAMEIGKIIKLRSYTTVVYKTGTCASACALMWIAGTRRVMFDGGKVGFHAAYTDATGSPIETGLGNALVGHYLSQLGFDEKAVIFATSAPPDKIAWLRQSDSQRSGIMFESIANDETAASSGTVPNSSGMSPSPNDQAEQFASAAHVGRTIKFFVDGLRAEGFQADADISNPESPRIFTGAGGDKMIVAFSSCDIAGCNYAEILAQWTAVTQAQANNILASYAREEQFTSALYSERDKTMSIYHYIILGKDGITVENLAEYISYFDKDFQAAGKLAQGSN